MIRARWLLVLTLAISSAAQIPAGNAERAHQDREILYELLDPATHAFRITHDYTESRPGTGVYLNVVRKGSKVKDPESLDLDSGEALKWEVLSGAEVKKRKLGSETVDDSAEVVVTYYAKPVTAGASVRVRLLETYVDAASYYEKDGELVWDRSLGRPRNQVVLPAGWRLTGSAAPATVATLEDGRVLLTFVNQRPDEVRVILRARRR